MSFARRLPLASVTLKLEGFDRLEGLLTKLPVLVAASGGPMDRAVKQAAKIVADKAIELAPDGDKSGTRKKQSKKSRQIWTGKLRRLVRVKLIRYDNGGAWAVVGPKSLEGNMSHFQQEKGRRLVLWGKSTMVARYRIQRNWITKAFDETKTQQVAAMEASIKADIEALAVEVR